MQLEPPELYQSLTPICSPSQPHPSPCSSNLGLLLERNGGAQVQIWDFCLFCCCSVNSAFQNHLIIHLLSTLMKETAVLIFHVYQGAFFTLCDYWLQYPFQIFMVRVPIQWPGVGGNPLFLCWGHIKNNLWKDNDRMEVGIIKITGASEMLVMLFI